MAGKMLTAAALASAIALSGAALAQASKQATLEVKEKQPYGKYLTDADGRALYMFTADKPGSSNCYDRCAEAWPPLVTAGKPQLGQAVDAALVGTIERKDGAMQVTYSGMPLYYYARDQGPGSTEGQDVHGGGGEWYLVSPIGKKIEAEKKG